MQTREEILDKHYKTKMHWKTVNRSNVLTAMSEYARPFQQRVEELEEGLRNLIKQLPSGATVDYLSLLLTNKNDKG